MLGIRPGKAGAGEFLVGAGHAGEAGLAEAGAAKLGIESNQHAVIAAAIARAIPGRGKGCNRGFSMFHFQLFRVSVFQFFQRWKSQSMASRKASAMASRKLRWCGCGCLASRRPTAQRRAILAIIKGSGLAAFSPMFPGLIRLVWP